MADAQVLLGQVTLSANSTSVVFSNIPQIYGDLILVTNCQDASVNEADAIIRFNGDSATNYSRIWMTGDGATNRGSGAQTNDGVYALIASTTRSTGSIFISEYSATNKFKPVLTRGNLSTGRVSVGAALWSSLSAINSLSINNVNNFTVGSVFTLYGVLK